MARQRATTTEAVIEAAARVFQARGYRNTTIEDIADAANISKPTVYKYARSKEWLLEQILKRVTADLDQRLNAITELDQSLEERLVEYIRVHVEAAIEMERFYAIILTEEHEMPARARRDFRRWAHRVTRDFADLLDEFRRAGILSTSADSMVLANLCITMFISLHRWYEPEGPVGRDQLVASIRDLVSGIVPVHEQSTVAKSV